MALVKCKECGHLISTKATSCPSCGNSKPEPTKYGCGTIILGIIVVSIFVGIFDDQKERSKPAQPKTAAEIRKDQIAPAFSAWDGSHLRLTRYIKEQLKDPDSYKHIKTTYQDNKDVILISTQYRAKNSFGGYVVSTATATAKIDGTLITVNMNE